MRLKGNDEAEEGDDGGSASGVGLGGGTLKGSGLLTNTSARRSGGLGGGAVAVGSLDLTVGDLGDGSASGSGGAGLNLSVGDLGNGSTGCASLNLSIANLGDTA